MSKINPMVFEPSWDGSPRLANILLIIIFRIDFINTRFFQRLNLTLRGHTIQTSPRNYSKIQLFVQTFSDNWRKKRGRGEGVPSTKGVTLTSRKVVGSYN